MFFRLDHQVVFSYNMFKGPSTRPVWIPDTDVVACQKCFAVFKTLTRKVCACIRFIEVCRVTNTFVNCSLVDSCILFCFNEVYTYILITASL